MNLPNCEYCGKFINPLKKGIESKDVHDFVGLCVDRTKYYHKSCKQLKNNSLNKNIHGIL